MLLSFLTRRGKIGVFPSVFKGVRTIFLSMAASTDESNKENVADGEVEQIVTMEKVVAADNKGIDYDKLISKFFLVCCHLDRSGSARKMLRSMCKEYQLGLERNKYISLKLLFNSTTCLHHRPMTVNQDCSSQLPGCLPYIGIKIIL